MYTIPTIPSDLRHEETIIQAAIALDCLHKTINSVFERIDARIGKNNAKVQELGQRIDKAQAKIKGLVGTKKAIKIFAPARFPATTQIFCDIPQTFTPMESQQQQQQHLYKQYPYDVQSRVDASSSQTYQEKLVFFHVRSMQQQTTTDVAGGYGTMIAAAKTRTNQRSGMGAMPEQLRSVSSLLLFDTDERVYDLDDSSGGVGKDTWKRTRLFKNQRQRTQAAALAAQNKQLLEPAPHSLANRNQQLTPSGGLRYTPRLNEAPEINLPLDLPDLPGIADDIHFEGKEQQQIAPSLFIENLPELPELLEESQATEETAEKAAMGSGNSDLGATTTPGTTINIPKLPTTSAPSPPPPPPLPLKSPSQFQTLMPIPPPPPPPAPPSLADITQQGANKSSAATSDTRSELMDAIRKAGGAKGGNLRRATAAAPVADTVESHDANLSSGAKPKVVGGDLMADLHNKLLMRRKGISGAKENTNTTATSTAAARNSAINDNSVISRLSALIPPPSARTARRVSDDDDDAEDDNDWVD